MKKAQEFITAESYIEMISKDYQFNPKSPDYLGFINIDPREADELGKNHSEVATRIAMNPDGFEKIANKYGLTIESAHETELIFSELVKKPQTRSIF